MFEKLSVREEGYETPLPILIDEVDNFSNKVEEHLKGIGNFGNNIKR